MPFIPACCCLQGKVIKREGNFDPVFWRHRMTGEHAGHPALTGRKRLGKGKSERHASRSEVYGRRSDRAQTRISTRRPSGHA